MFFLQLIYLCSCVECGRPIDDDDDDDDLAEHGAMQIQLNYSVHSIVNIGKFEQEYKYVGCLFRYQPAMDISLISQFIVGGL